MSRLSKFLGSPVEIDLEGDKYLIYPLKVEDMQTFHSDMSEEQTNETAKKLLLKSLKDEEGLTIEEINNLPLNIFTKLMEGFNKVNGFEEQEKRTSKIAEKLANARGEQ